MGLNLFKRRAARRESSGKLTEEVEQRHSNHSTAKDDSTASLRSNRSSVLEAAARDGKWDQFVKIAKDSHSDDWTSTTCDDEHHCLHGSTTPLHVALAHRAPLKTVETIIDMLATQFKVPVPEEAIDEQGRTPLHIAAAACCDEQVALRLLSGSALCMPAVAVCADGQTPLHVAARQPIPIVKKKNPLGPNPVQLMKWNKRRVLSILMEHYPEATAICDHAGKTPLDYVVEAGMKDSAAAEMKRLYEEHAPDRSNEKNGRVCADRQQQAQRADVPLVVPSLTGSCRDFASLSSMNLANVLDQVEDAPQEQRADDVSTIGDKEAEMYTVGSWEDLE